MLLRLITNPLASGVSEGIVSAVAARLSAVADLEIVHTERQGHATELAAEVESGAVVSLGGDGTTNEVVNGIATGVRLGVLPAGASSVYARHLGFPDAPVEASSLLAEAISADRTRPVGMGVLDGRRFTFAASVGFDATATRTIDEARRVNENHKRPGDARVFYETLRVLRSQGFQLSEQMTVTAGAADPIRASYIAVANQHPYTYFGRIPVNATPRAAFDSGLDAVLLGDLTARALPRLAFYALVWPRHATSTVSGVTYLHDRDRFVIACDEPVAVQIDGEYIGERERIEISYEPDALPVYLPAR
jgi:diacylglycerol kinase family enzyme